MLGRVSSRFSQISLENSANLNGILLTIRLWKVSVNTGMIGWQSIENHGACQGCIIHRIFADSQSQNQQTNHHVFSHLTSGSFSCHGGFRMSFAIAPSPSELTDFIDQIEQAVQLKTGGRIRGLRILVDDGCVIVSGLTTTYYIKQLVTHAIRETVEDLSVRNEVEVC
jgi:hypothetical protein